MDTESSGRLGDKDEDIDVDHYFLPGGILDTHHEEDMIGGSLLDEIGGAGNVKADLLPAKQIAVSRIVGSDPRTVASIAADRPQLHRKSISAISAEPTQRLSVEGTNPMAKEFKPSARSAVEAHPGGSSHPQTRLAASETPNRAFSAAVGSEVVKTTAVEQPRFVSMQRQVRKLPRPPGPLLPQQTAAQVSLGDRGQQHPRHQSGGTLWPIRTTTASAHPGPPAPPSKHRAGVPNQGHMPSPPGFPPRGVIQQRSHRAQGQASGASPGSSQRRDRVAPSKYQSGKFGQYSGGTWDANDRVSLTKPGGQFAGIAQSVRPQQQRRNRNFGPFPPAQFHDQGDTQARVVAKAGISTGGERIHDEAGGNVHRRDHHQAAPKGSSRNRTQTHPTGLRRVSHGLNNHPEQAASTKVSSRRQEAFVDTSVQLTTESRLKSAGDQSSQRSASSSLTTEPGHETKRQAPDRLALSSVHQQEQPSEATHSDEEVTTRSRISQQSSSDRWTGGTGERGARQVKSEDDHDPAAGHFQSHYKDKDKDKDKDRARLKKKDDKACRPPSKQLLGTSVKEPSRIRMGARPSLSQRSRLLIGYIHSLALGLAATFVRMITWQLNRLRLVRRMLALVSVVTSSGVSLLSIVITATSWLFLLGLRLHSLALKEVTGSVHVAVCFLFPYCFQYLVYAIDEWAPHWLPACLWYSFLMQMCCTSNHQYKHSMSSHLVPALRALLPVAFLCEVPSGRSYLLALGGSELLLLSFTLAAVRLRCIFSPIFLISWASQVFALATCGSSASLQYTQVLVSLASLHAVSMVDVMLNSRFYHARYRAGMSLTNGFRRL